MRTTTGSWMGSPRTQAFISWGNRNVPFWTSQPMGEHEWQSWEEDLRCAIRAERRVASIARHPFLSLQPRSIQINGLTQTRKRYPADPLSRPAGAHPLSRALFDELYQLRRTLSANLTAFTNLTELQFSYQAIDCELLDAIDRHPTVTELRFDFCWFPEETRPLTSVLGLKLYQIPGSYSRSRWPSDRCLYEGVPCHHLVSAFNLISPAHVQRLDVKIQVPNASEDFVLEQLCQASNGQSFRWLEQLVLTLNWVPSDLAVRFFKRTPALRELQVNVPSQPWTNGPIPPQCIPLLENLTCPIDWARFIVPGRPIKVLALLTESDTHRETQFSAPTEADLEAFLGPLALSRGPISQLHLPSYPPFAPLSILMPSICMHFPHLQGLKCAISGARTARQGSACFESLNDDIPWPDKEMYSYDVLEKDVEALAKEIRKDVEASFLPSPVIRPSSPGLARLSAFLKGSVNKFAARRGTRGKAQGHSTSQLPSPPKASSMSLPAIAVGSHESAYPTMCDWENMPTPTQPTTASSTPFFDTYFGDIDSESGMPQREPWHVSVSSIS